MPHFGKKLHLKEKHLYWENEEPFFLLADTVWYGLTKRCTEKEFEHILFNRKEKGFTAIQVVVGTPPESEIWNENAQSTHGYFIYNKDLSINTSYFDDIQKKIDLLIKHELVPVIYGSWGQYIDELGEKPVCEMWNHIIKRFSGYPVIYSLCGEADIFTISTMRPSTVQKILSKIPGAKKLISKLVNMNRKTFLKERITKWQNIAKYIVQQNGANHPLTVHIQSDGIASEVFPDPSFIDIDSFQSGHSSHGIERMHANFAKLKQGSRAFANLEPLYEGILEQTDPRLQTYAFWKSVFSGAVGHVYGAHGLWQLAGTDNFMNHWGDSSWKKALAAPGSTTIGSAKNWIEKTNWQTFEEKQIPITYDKKPFIPAVAGSIDKTLYLYIPELKSVQSIHIKEQVSSTECFDASTYKKIGIQSLTDIQSIQTQHNDVIFVLKIV